MGGSHQNLQHSPPLSSLALHFPGNLSAAAQAAPQFYCCLQRDLQVALKNSREADKQSIGVYQHAQEL